MKTIFIEKESYYDSALLMLTSQEVKKTSGVHDATVAMGTAMNLDLLLSLGFDAAALAEATPNDLVFAIDCESAESAAAARAAAKQALSRKAKAATGAAAHAAPTSLASALRAQDDANLAVISLPGAYAAREARKALESGLHVMLFSDNVSLEDEIALKALSRSKGLLMMGPDCGTAIINGMPLCFANVVRRGPIGVIGASGTGIQEVTCLIDRAGSGVSQAIGAGGRDLKNERVGGATTLMGIEALAGDDETKVIVIISKPPAKAVAEQVVAALERAGKPAVAFFVGATPEASRAGSVVRFAANLEETAAIAVALAEVERYEPRAFTRPTPRSRRSSSAKRAASRPRNAICAAISPAARSPTRPGSSRTVPPAPSIPTTRPIPASCSPTPTARSATRWSISATTRSPSAARIR